MNRADYRNRLNDKLVDLEDEGYGDFEFTVAELNTYLELATARLYPYIFKRVATTNVPLVKYGTLSLGYFLTQFSDRIFLVEDAVEFDVITEWKPRPDRVIGIDTLQYTNGVNYYYHDAFSMPPDDQDDVGLPAVCTPLLVLGALIEALESRHDTGVRGDPLPEGTHQEIPLIDRLQRRYDALRNDIGMNLPGVML